MNLDRRLVQGLSAQHLKFGNNVRAELPLIIGGLISLRQRLVSLLYPAVHAAMGRERPTHYSLPNVLCPKGGVILNKLAHELDAALVLDDLDLHAAAREPLLLAHEGLVFADDDPWDAVE